MFGLSFYNNDIWFDKVQEREDFVEQLSVDHDFSLKRVS